MGALSHLKAVCADWRACLYRLCPPDSEAVCLCVFRWLCEAGWGWVPGSAKPSSLSALCGLSDPSLGEHLQGLVLPGLI